MRATGDLLAVIHSPPTELEFRGGVIRTTLLDLGLAGDEAFTAAVALYKIP